ncbi:MAG: DUF502 domain-containing protein [Planctomycetes bacterium]|nr:DUF502 domain-containing protein [Planctomycetota bacterium]
MALRIKRPSLLTRFRNFLRSNFIAGMFIALPLAITVAVLGWVWERLDGPLSLVFASTHSAGGMGERLLRFARGTPVSEDIVIPLMGLCILILAVLFLGIVIRSLIGRYLLSIFEHIVTHLPFVGILYSSVKQLGEAFISDDGKSKFQSAVLVQFPMQGSWVIGFVTGTAYAPLAETMAGPLKQEAAAKGAPPPDIITVFVPTTPLPTQGFTLVLPRSETRELPISVEEAIKLVISGGIINHPTTSHRQPVQTPDFDLPQAKPASGKSEAPQKA